MDSDFETAQGQKFYSLLMSLIGWIFLLNIISIKSTPSGIQLRYIFLNIILSLIPHMISNMLEAASHHTAAVQTCRIILGLRMIHLISLPSVLVGICVNSQLNGINFKPIWLWTWVSSISIGILYSIWGKFKYENFTCQSNGIIYIISTYIYLAISIGACLSLILLCFYKSTICNERYFHIILTLAGIGLILPRIILMARSLDKNNKFYVNLMLADTIHFIAIVTISIISHHQTKPQIPLGTIKIINIDQAWINHHYFSPRNSI